MGKYRYPVVVFVFGIVMFKIGTFFQMMRWSGGLFFTTFPYPFIIVSSFWVTLLVLLRIIMGKYRYPLVLFLVSFFALAVGAFFRTMRWPGGELIVGAMFFVQAFAIIWLIVLLLRRDKKL